MKWMIQELVRKKNKRGFKRFSREMFTKYPSEQTKWGKSKFFEVVNDFSKRTEIFISNENQEARNILF